MPQRRIRLKFQQFTEFEQERIIGLCEGGFFYRVIAALVQRNSSTVIRVSKQYVDKHLTNRKNGSGWRKLTSAHNDRRLVCMEVNDCTASSEQLAARWSIANRDLMSASLPFMAVSCTLDWMQEFLYTGYPSRQTIDGCVYYGLMKTEPGILIGKKLPFLTSFALILKPWWPHSC